MLNIISVAKVDEVFCCLAVISEVNFSPVAHTKASALRGGLIN